MGVILFGGAQYSLPEQANLTLIFFPKIVGDGGGEVTKIYFPYIPQKLFPDISTNILQNFPDIVKKIYVIFAKIQKFFYDIKIFLYVLPEFRSDFCPTVKFGGGTCPPMPPRPIRPLQYVAIHSGQQIYYENEHTNSRIIVLITCICLSTRL
jgi:hypothetical protein